MKLVIHEKDLRPEIKDPRKHLSNEFESKLPFSCLNPQTQGLAKQVWSQNGEVVFLYEKLLDKEFAVMSTKKKKGRKKRKQA